MPLNGTPQQMQVPAGHNQGTDEGPIGDEEEINGDEGHDEEPCTMAIGSYGEDEGNHEDGRCERGMDRSGDYGCESEDVHIRGWHMTRRENTMESVGADGNEKLPLDILRSCRANRW